MRLEELYRQNCNLLSETELLVWEFICKNRKLCESISIDELAQLIHVSRTTVLRLAKHLGLSGFSELKVLLRLENEQIKNNMLNTADNLAHSLNSYIEKMKNMDFKRAIELLSSANNIFAYGTGELQKNVINELKRSFLYAHELIDVIDSLHDYESGIKLMQEKDVVIIVTYSGNNPELVDFVKKAKLKNVQVIMISVLINNDLRKHVDCILNVEVDNINNNLGPRYDRILNYFVLIDFLVVEYMHKEINND